MNPMHTPEQTLKYLADKASQLSQKKALVGFDGFVDKIVTPIDKRQGPGEAFTPINTLQSLGERISAAANKSTNIELHLQKEKLGGNGPILANGLVAKGIPTRYIGSLGHPDIHPVFLELAKKTQAVSLCEPGITHAIECDDGKLLLGIMESLETVTYDRIIEVMGEGAFQTAVNEADLIAMVNWTMLPHLTPFFADFIEKTLKHLGSRDQRLFFFDLADPEKRSEQDLKTALQTIKLFQSYGSVTLGLNLKESTHVLEALGHTPKEKTTDNLKWAANTIRQDLNISTVVIHPTECAVCADKHDAYYVKGYPAEKPLIGTGGGDHFNAGFVMGQLLGLTPEDCLRIATACSGFYVRTAKSPGLNDVSQFIKASS